MASPLPAPVTSPSAPPPPAVLPVPIISTPIAAPPIANFSPPPAAVTRTAPRAAPPSIFTVSNPPPPATKGASPVPGNAPIFPSPPNNPAAVPIVSPAVFRPPPPTPGVSPPPTPSGPSPPPPSGPSPPPPRGPPAIPPISSTPIPIVIPSPPVAPSPPPFPPLGTPRGPPAILTPTSSSPPPQTPSSPVASPPPPTYPPPPYPSPPPGAPPFSPPPPAAPPLPPPPPGTVATSGGVSKGVIIGASAGGAALLLALLALFIYCCVCAAGSRDEDEENRKRRAVGPLAAGPYKSDIVGDGGSYPNSGTSNPAVGVDPSISGYGSNTTSGSWFAYDELTRATENFALKNKLGEGGFGKVYKGVMPDGKVIAVKVLTLGGGQGEREFRAEVEIISRVHHRHLVTLLGYCIANAERLLVYEYVPLGSLEYNLRSRTMDWTLRMRVALGVAKGLAYLHEDCHPRIFHRDIKSSNILIDLQYEAQLADFGLAKLAPDAFTHVSTRVMGTFGYLAPEYATTGKLTDKSDVFSYGVVLLELISGRKPVDETQPPGQESLVEFARPLLIGRLEEVIDPRLDGRFEEAEMKQMAEVASLCIRSSAALRPRMGQVVQMLQSSDMGFSGEAGHSQLHSVAFGGSQTFDADQYSAEMRQQYGQDSHQMSSGGGGGGEYSGDQSMASYNNSRPQSTYGSGEQSHQSGQGLPPTHAGRVTEWSQGATEEFRPSGGMPMFSGELDYGQGKLVSDRLQEGR